MVKTMGYWRSFRIANARQWNEAHGEFVRAKRRPKRLPNTQDEYYRSEGAGKRSWKRSKKRHQWGVKPTSA